MLQHLLKNFTKNKKQEERKALPTELTRLQKISLTEMQKAIDETRGNKDKYTYQQADVKYQFIVYLTVN